MGRAYVISARRVPPTVADWELIIGDVVPGAAIGGWRLPGVTIATGTDLDNFSKVHPTLLAAIQAHGVLSDAVWCVRKEVQAAAPDVYAWILRSRRHAARRARVLAAWDAAHPAPRAPEET
jgi:hypothetical protein